MSGVLAPGVDAIDRGLDLANSAHVWVVTEDKAVKGRPHSACQSTEWGCEWRA